MFKDSINLFLTQPFRQPSHPCLCCLLTELKLAFSLFDRDKDGNISMAEVRHVMNTLGQRINDRQLQAMFKQVDLDGKLNLIASMLKKLSSYYTMRFRYFALAKYPNVNKTLFFFFFFFFIFRKIWIMKSFSQKMTIMAVKNKIEVLSGQRPLHFLNQPKLQSAECNIG